MNAYERRLARRTERNHQHNEARNYVAAQNRHLLMTAYEEAYLDLYDRKVKVKYNSGWYEVGSSNIREGQLRQMAETLKARKHEQELGVVE